MSIKLLGSTSGYVILDAPAVALNNTITLPSGGVALATLSTSTPPTNGQIPVGNGSTFTPANLVGSGGINITNGVGSVTISANVAGSSLYLANTYGGF